MADDTGLRSTSMPVPASVEDSGASDLALDAQLLELFFDRVPMGVAVFSTDLRLQRCNKTWSAYFEHYLGVGPEHTAPGRHLAELIPGNDEALGPLVENALAGRTVRQAAHRLTIPGVETYWDVTFAPLFDGGRVVGVVDIVTDATDRVLAARQLESRIATFTSLAEGMTVDQPLETTLREVLHAARATTAAVAASIVARPFGASDGPVGYVDGWPEEYADALVAGWTEVADGDSASEEWPRIAMRPGLREAALSSARLSALHPFWTASAPPDWEDAAIVPVISSGHAFGELTVYLPAGHELPDDDRAYLIALADQAAVAVQNSALLAAATQSAGVTERQRLARELHDSVSQSLFAMTMHARAAERQLAALGVDERHPAHGEVAQLRELTSGALAEMRALIFELRPGALTEEGLVRALSKQATAVTARTQIPVVVEGPSASLELPPPVEEHLYRLAMEAMNNALKHAAPSAVRITITAADEHDAHSGLRIDIVDDGQGFDTGVSHPGHLGLGTMRERATTIGALLDVASTPGQGTRVRVRLPASC
jgi:signal transduction histidine kinase